MRVITSVVITCKLQDPCSYDLRKEAVTSEFAQILRDDATQCGGAFFRSYLSINREKSQKGISSTFRLNSIFPDGKQFNHRTLDIPLRLYVIPLFLS